MQLIKFYEGKKVFITGHTGFKGSWLCQILLELGAEVTGFSLEPPTSPALFDQLSLANQINSIIGDVRNLDLLKKSMRETEPEIIFHLAAQPLVLDSYKKPVETYEINVMGTVNVLQSALETPSIKSIVNVTTDKVYENKEWLWGYRENENLNGFDPYSNSKSCSELVTSSFRNSFYSKENSPSLSTARSGNVIGGGDYSGNRIIPDCVRAVNNKEVIIVRNPNSTRPYQHVLECLYGYLTLAAKQYKNINLAGAYNFGPNDNSCVTTGQLTDLFCSIWRDEASWESKEIDSYHEANFLRLDHTKSTRMLGWKPIWDIKTAVTKVIEFAQCKNNEERQKCLKQQIKDYFREIKQ